MTEFKVGDKISPAIERVAAKQFRDYGSVYSTDGMTVADFHHTARDDLSAALDVEEMARALREKYKTGPSATAWSLEVAQTIRDSILGEAS